MNKSDLLTYIANVDKLAEETLPPLEDLVATYPYFQTARLLLAKNRYATNRAAFEKNVEKTAVFCADRSRFFYLINNEKYACFFPGEKPGANADRTQLLLDSYLNTFTEEHEEIQKTKLSIVSTDYLAYLQSEEKETQADATETTENEFKHQHIIDSFLEKAAAHEIGFTPTQQEPSKVQDIDPEPESDGFLTETLAKIYIKQKKYEQALTIIRQLSLNFPKKSVYFADQIRFLELLILNEKNKKE